MGQYISLLDTFSASDGRQLTEDELETLETEIRKLKSQRSAFVGLCATLLRGISLQTTQPARAAAVLGAAKADYDQLLKTL
jgi:hypothetical protein